MEELGGGMGGKIIKLHVFIHEILKELIKLCKNKLMGK